MKTKSAITKLVSVLPLTAVLGLLLVPGISRAQEPIACGQTLTGNITSSSQIDTYTFFGTAGELVFVGFYYSSDLPYTGTLSLYRPSGASMTNVTTSGGSGFNVTLPDSGIFRITVRAHNWGGGPYGYYLTLGCNGTAIPCGPTPVSGSIDEPSQMAGYTFNGIVGQVLSVGFYWSTVSGGTADIYNPSGRWITNVTASAGAQVISLTLPSSGVYTIAVHGAYYDAVGSYCLSLQPRSGGGCVSIPCGGSVIGGTQCLAEMDGYAFSGDAGMMFLVGFFWANGAGTADIYDPDGRLVTSVSATSGGNAVNLTLASTGTYTILVHASNYNLTSSYYNLSIQSRPSGCGTAIACGQWRSASTSYPSELDAYSYAGTAGQVLSVGFYWPNGAGTADIYDPSGQWVTSVSATSGGNAGNLTLASTGTYTILTHASHYNVISSYNLSIQSRAGGGCNATSIACGQSVNASTGPASELDAYSYAGTAGQMLSVGFYWATGAGTADIYDPSGQLVTSVSATSGANVGNLTLASSGTYTIVVHASNYNVTSSYNLSIQSRNGGGCGGAIACGHSVSASTGYYSELDAYSCAGTAGQIMFLAFYWTSGAGTADIYDPSGQWVTSVSATSGGGAVSFTLASSGSYTILVHASNYNATSSYNLSLQSRTGGGCGGTLACGHTVSGLTTNSCEVDAYSFAGTAGQLLSLAFYWGTGAGTADIYDPTGQPVASVTATAGGNVVNSTLASSGTYTILVYADYNVISSYDLSVQSHTGGGCAGTTVTGGQTVNASTGLPTEMDAYGFASVGGTVIFSFSGYGGARFDLYEPTGNRLFVTGPASVTNVALPAGTYTLLVHDANYGGTGSYGFTVTCVCNYLPGPASVWVGASATNGTLTVTATNGSGCAWTATTNASWLTIASGSSGTGNGTVSYAVTANCTASARVGTITISEPGTTSSATFTVNQASPVAFVGQDIGTPGAPGSWVFTNCGTYIVSGSGEGTDGSADVCYFFYQTLAGDGQIMARLLSLQGGDPQLAEAGVMIRQSLDPGSQQVSLSVNARTNVVFRRRLTANALGIRNTVPGGNYLQGTNYLWLRLMRMGNTFVAYCSTNGLNWQSMGFTTMNLSNPVEVGLAVTAQHYAELTTAVFDNLSAGGLTPLPGSWSFPGPLLLMGGQNWSPAEFQRVGGFEFLLEGAVGDYFSILGSSNVALRFASWSQVATVTNIFGVVPVLDAGASTNKMRFYRAQRLGP